MHIAPLTPKPGAVNFTAMADGHLRKELPKAQQAHAAATQFEAIMVRQLLSQSVGKMMSGGSEGGSKAGGDIYGYMLTDSLADKIAQGGGLGLARMLEKQFTPKGAPLAPTAKP